MTCSCFYEPIMTTSLSSLLCITTLLIITFSHLLVFSPVSSFYQPPNSYRGLSFEEIKTRLGSIPPSCHNKCNQCHPCVAVQMPTLLGKQQSHVQVKPGFKESLQPSPNLDSKYSNYKPLGWKCRCNGHFYNP